MTTLNELLSQILNKELIQIILSNSQDKEFAAKVKIRPVLIKGELLFQETLYRGTQVFHENFDRSAMSERIEKLLTETFRQGEFQGSTLNATVLVGKKGNMTIKTKRLQNNTAPKERDLSHNREKQYILQEGVAVDFLVGLGVQTPEGKITKTRYDKFRQINRYLEFIEDVLDKLPTGRTIRIIDFGCGKSYLTFAMYYYLHVLQKRDICVTGLDLKKDVIAHCNALAKQCGYEKLTFEVGDISTYNGSDAVDMVVSLHACDTATDYAIEKAVKWGASVIMAVPCCQHEVNKQISCKELQPLLKYGLIKERMAALITDAVRANLLEEQGYDTQILEFIDMEHTPKNLLIRAVKKGGAPKMTGKKSVQETLDFLHIEPTLQKLLQE
ncbi:MAG: SAM-dependent methyltransferase [Lachnospiraceae bacterium]|nr:SAM-dependent methyltransferase [Lachnospiraceae bacterium]